MGGEIEIGSVFGRGFELLRRNLIAFGLLSLLLVAGPNAIPLLFHPASESLATLPAIGSYLAMSTLPILVGGLLYYLVVIVACLANGAGRQADLARALATALMSFLPVFAAVLLKWLAVLLGLLVLVIPGVVAYCMFAVVVPVMIAEDLGPIAALQRSRELTEMNRMSIFGIFFLIGAAQAVAAVTFTLIGGAVGGGPVVEAVVSVLVPTAVALVEAPVTAALYIALKTVKEGGLNEGLVRVFE